MTNKTNPKHAARVRLFQMLCALDSLGSTEMDQLEIESRLEDIFVSPVLMSEKEKENETKAKSALAFMLDEPEAWEVNFEQFRCDCSVICALRRVLNDIDRLIAENVTGWTPDRMMLVDRAILRLALYEGFFARSVPVAVAISEAVLLAKEYGSDDSPRFVNGLLAKIARAQQDVQ